MRIFKAKPIQIGFRVGIIIPKKVLLAEGLAVGDEAEFYVVHREDFKR